LQNLQPKFKWVTQKKLTSYKKTHSDEISQYQAKTQEEQRVQKESFENSIFQQKKENDDFIAKLKFEYEQVIAQMKQQYEEETKKTKENSDTKIAELRNALQKLQDLLPARSEKEGFLTKQGGGHKSWKKRYFVLKTNFICYYKDSKNLSHPQGVIDLNDSSVRMAPFDIAKKKHCFEVVTPLRTFCCRASSDEEVDGWIKAIDGAKAKYKSELLSRKTFIDLTTSGKIPTDTKRNTAVL